MSPLLRALSMALPISLFLSLGEWPRLPFTARIERAQFHRARSASKKGTWPLPSLLADFFSVLITHDTPSLWASALSPGTIDVWEWVPRRKGRF
jgi:hypothetical protein